MQQLLKKLFSLPAYPFLVTLFPIVYVFASNIGFTGFSTILPLTFAALLATILMWSVANIWMKDRHKSGLLASIAVLLFFTYGSFYAATDQVTFFSLDMHKHRYTMLASALVVLLTWRMLKNVGAETAEKLGKMASAGALLLLAMPTFTLATSYWQTAATASPKATFLDKSKIRTSPTDYPDVYYFILDGYGREDVMQQRLGFDNSGFIKELEKRGFYIAKRSHSNYAQTLLSITSSLNMRYLQEIYVPSKQSFSYFREIFKNNTVIQNFNDLGYKTINTASGYDFTNVLNTQLTLAPTYALTEFESAIYNNSVLPFLFNNDIVLKFTRSTQVDFIRSFLFEQHRQKIKLALEQPCSLPLKPGQPIMAFLHVLVAHQPFVFKASGSPVTPDGPFALAMYGSYKNDQIYRQAYIKGYINQVLYGNRELLKTIDAIQSRKDRKSIIILQGDHGPWSLPHFGNMSKGDYAERMSILNAMYFPDSTVTGQLYDDITPVNTFKIIFNHYFNAGYKLEKDNLFFSGYENRFFFKDITDVLDPNKIEITATK